MQRQCEPAVTKLRGGRANVLTATPRATRKCCTNKTSDFTPDPDDVPHQRKLAQRGYYGSLRWRQLFKRRALVEGAFVILKNASHQRLRRGQNRLPGLAMASIVAGVKISVYNEEQLRAGATAPDRVRPTTLCCSPTRSTGATAT